MDPIILDALRLALQRRRYDFGGQVEWSAPKEPEPVKQPDEEEQEKFLKEQLVGSAPQYEPEAGLKTAKEAGLMAAGFAPGSGIASAAGAFPTAEGGFEPSLREDISAGRYGSAVMKGVGAAGDVISAVPVVGTALGTAMKAPLALKLATAMAPAAKIAREAAPAAKAVEEVAEAAPAYQRLVNPAGFYSRAHEVAMTELPDQPRTWQEMHSLLSKAPRVQKEELYWSGIHPETFAPGEKVSREQIAELIEKNFPKVEPEIRSESSPGKSTKYGQYTVPGGTDYEERILRHQFTSPRESVEHPEVLEKYAPEYNKRFNNSLKIFEELEKLRNSRNPDPERIGELERQQQENSTAIQELRHKILEESQALAPYSPEYTHQRYTHSHWDDTTNPVVHTRNSTRTGPNGEKIWHQEEMQSDWAQEGREKGFRKPPPTPQELAEHKELSKLPFSEYTPEQKARYDFLSHKIVDASLGIPSAPYTRDTEHWLELAAKDTLKEAIERGYDKIFITGGQEQAKRWANELRQAVDNVRWENAPNTEDVKNILAQNKWNENYANLTSWQQQQVDRHILENPQDLPDAPQVKTVYAKPVGSNEEHSFVVKQVEGPGGKPRFEVVDSSIPKAKGETLSSVIGGDLAKRVMAEESGDVPMKGYRMGSEGYTQTYERKAPSIYKKLLKSLDPEAKVEAGPLELTNKQKREEINDFVEEFTYDTSYNLLSEYGVRSTRDLEPYQRERFERDLRAKIDDAVRAEFGEEGQRVFRGEAPKEGVQGTYINITPKMREKYFELKKKHGAVFPAYKDGGSVDSFLNASYNEPRKRFIDHALKVSRKHAK